MGTDILLWLLQTFWVRWHKENTQDKMGKDFPKPFSSLPEKISILKSMYIPPFLDYCLHLMYLHKKYTAYIHGTIPIHILQLTFYSMSCFPRHKCDLIILIVALSSILWDMLEYPFILLYISVDCSMFSSTSNHVSIYIFVPESEIAYSHN